jgi:GT2 family glycosyltransferase
MRPDVTVIVVNYNGGAFIGDCLDSVLAQTAFCKAMRVVVVDNASIDDSLGVIQSRQNPVMQVIRNPTNVGFSQAHNQLIDTLDSPYMWLVNNDTCFDPHIDIITPIIQVFESDPSIVGISPKLRNTDGSIQCQGSALFAYRYRRKTPTVVPFLSGAALFIRTDFFKTIGGFDPRLYFYNDDIDFAYQAKKHHKKLLYYPLVAVTHHGGLSTRFQPVKTRIAGYLGSLIICQKYYPRAIFYVYKVVMIRWMTLMILYHNSRKTASSSEWSRSLWAAIQQIKSYD